MSPNAYYAKMLEAADAQSEALARIEAKVDGLVERLDRQDEALAYLVQEAEARASERHTSKRSAPK